MKGEFQIDDLAASEIRSAMLVMFHDRFPIRAGIFGRFFNPTSLRRLRYRSVTARERSANSAGGKLFRSHPDAPYGNCRRQAVGIIL